jgi:NADH-quinone oxidoreductase subunit F
MLFRSFCALADGAVSPIDSSIRFFREEYEEHVRLGRCPLREAPATTSVALEAAADRAAEPPAGPILDLDEVLG